MTTFTPSLTDSAPTEAAVQPRQDLLVRSRVFAQSVRALVRKTPRSLGNMSDIRALIKASGSIGYHYIGADEAGSREEFIAEMSAARRESRNCALWLGLLTGNPEDGTETARQTLLHETAELERIFNAIVFKTLRNAKLRAQATLHTAMATTR